MIIGERKSLEEIRKMIGGYKRVLVVGCGTCVTVCLAGGEKEVATLSSALRMAAKKDGDGLEISEATIERQCDIEFIEELREKVEQVDAALSMGCGAGVQTIAETFSEIPVYPALNTRFIGRTEEQGVWTERCAACGDCILHVTGGICPIARCSKSLLNGPCGGSKDGKCEINPDVACAWQLIYDRLKALDQLDKLEEIVPVKDWSVSRDGGPRKLIREDVRL
ncbi:MAG: methylenetetrahydrofolate reductase C-terminal domain-containing protein [Desulfobacterales bacterium]|nr:methylenetetrahydrofolate reductase C-terminal domain-containing protein [Desulfobacterales bacterium]